MEVIKEESTAYLEITFLDKDDLEEAPSSATYRIDGGALDAETLTEIQDDTALPPGASVELTLTPAFNTLLSQADPYEQRLVTVKAAYGGGQGVNDKYKYLVENLAKVP